MKHGKKYVEAAKLIEKAKLYEADEAIALVKKSASAKFDETVELHIRTGCDSRHADQQIRGAVVLPNGTGKTVKVLVFAKGTKLDEAQAAGADDVGGDELSLKIQSLISRLVRLSTVLTRLTLYTFRSERLLSQSSSSQRTTMQLWKLFQRLSQAQLRVSILSLSPLQQQWDLALRS